MMLNYSFALTWTNWSVCSLLFKIVSEGVSVLILTNIAGYYIFWLDQDSSYILWSLIVSSDMDQKNGESFQYWGRWIHWLLSHCMSLEATSPQCYNNNKTVLRVRENWCMVTVIETKQLGLVPTTCVLSRISCSSTNLRTVRSTWMTVSWVV
jgi:hypothetical protein